jgi:hypothetical protein
MRKGEKMKTPIENDLRYLASEEALDKVLEDLRTNKATVPQPEGEMVANAYQDGRLTDPSAMLHVIACLLRKLR